MVEPGPLPKLLEILEAGLDNMPITFLSQRNAPAEPCLFAEFHDLFEGVPSRLIPVGEVKLRRRHVSGMYLLDVSLHHRTGEWIPVNDLPHGAGAVTAKR